MSHSSKRKFKPRVFITLLAIAAFAMLIKQGTAQLSYSNNYNNYINAVHTTMLRPAVPMPSNISDVKDWEFTRVTMAGRFLYKHEFLIQPRFLNDEKGYNVLVPFQRASGNVVMINRGWVSEEKLSEINRPNHLLKIEGIIQASKQADNTPNNKPEHSEWYWADVNTMAAEAGLKNVSPVIVNIAERVEDQYPIGGTVRAKSGKYYLYYAVLWYLMAILLLNTYITSQMRIEEVKLELEERE